MINIGVIGYGYWGPNLVRNFSEGSQTNVVIVADQDESRLQLLHSRYPSIEVTRGAMDVINHPRVDAVAIATPVCAHFDLAIEALRAGKHVFVEKPLAETSAKAEQLIEEAQSRCLLLHVDHTFVYTSAVRKMREIVAQGELGDLYYYDSVRVNLGLFQSDVNVLWDLAVHDLSIMDYVFPGEIAEVSAAGATSITGKQTNIAFMTIRFENDAIAHFHVNWLAPVKVRRTLVGGSRKMIVYDDLEPSEKIKIYDKGITLEGGKEEEYGRRIGYRTGDMWAPQLSVKEALLVEADHFAACIAEGKTSDSDGQAGLKVVRILEAASRSLLERGRPVKFGWKGRE